MNYRSQTEKKIVPTKLFFVLYLLLTFLLFLYSFTQVDLGLTLTRTSALTAVQHAFQYIGYFNRPLSTSLYLAIIFFLFGLYIWSIKLVIKKQITKKMVWLIIFCVSLILVFSYNAFSHDIFNYIFDARIVTYYRENPYFKKALDYPNDPMLAFMHWTHRTYPYGPIWLLLTIPLSFLGFSFFIPTFLLFKIMSGLSYLGSAYLISKITRYINEKYELLSLTFFALNPLVLIESLVSGHNDIVMMFLLLVSILFLVNQRFIWSFLFLFLSIGIKYATGFLLPIYLAIWFFKKKESRIVWQNIFLIFVIAMLFALVAAILRTQFQPWYLLFVIPLASLVTQKKYILVPTIFISFGALLNYAPYLYWGNWNDPVPKIIFFINLLAAMLASISICWLLVRKKFNFSL
ncbi:MAG: hypothetical protein KatS3mg089_0370 [Patescibacteria group bacterium]|nr:MAG: hypothetical protein KatS3mg089_0370 [Patescibacteria group bacterium]